MSTTTDTTAPAPAAAAPADGFTAAPSAATPAPTDSMVAAPTAPTTDQAAAPTDGLAAHTPAPAATTAPTDHPAPAAAAPTHAHGHAPNTHTTTQSHHAQPHHATSADPNLPVVYSLNYKASETAPDAPGYLIEFPDGARVLMNAATKDLVETAIYTCPKHQKTYHVTSTAKEKAGVTASEHAHGARTHMNVSGNIQFNGHTTTAASGHGAEVHVTDAVTTAMETATTAPVQYTSTTTEAPAPAMSAPATTAPAVVPGVVTPQAGTPYTQRAFAPMTGGALAQA